MTTKYLLTSVAMGVFLLSGCTQTTPDTTSPEASGIMPEGQENTGAGMAADEGVDMMVDDATPGTDVAMGADEADYAMEMSNFSYSVDEIMASPGQTITIHLTNVEGMHDFDIDELAIDTEVIQAGEVMTVEVTIPADAVAGDSYTYYCSVGNHRAQGMEGMIIVE